ncbi:hypothetical protein A2125_00360 [Candidatus Woesebacteria bacterium GWB1_43_5]|uniref:Uncharacterized protein n=1 Tax=Candidatus Woesebacteria bacterium GWB1_43_5 TaxID=1802474 RepID=A0A1F7WT25_9BACT|nr:MAG: hypothetical protein A2125_00360 [Candidatus Woesebacteria bacterium GWB1_43_5]
MKKFLPIILVVVGVLVFGVVLLLKAGAGVGVEDENANLRDIPLSERPFTSLIPKEDGHWLKMVIEEVKITDAKQLDYELLYRLPDGRTQGVPGTISLVGAGRIERDLLLGSESSGKFRYDEGVEEGTLTLRFRNDKRKLIGKLSTDFHLQKEAKELTSVDGKFKYTLDKEPKNVFFVVMETFGLPKETSGVVSGPYGVFASLRGPFLGTVSLADQIMRWDEANWKPVGEKKSPNIGIFIGVGE